MAAFEIRRDTRLSPAQAWARITDWPSHGRYVPLTRITVEPPPPSGVGTVVTARTGRGRIGFDDPMHVVEWDPPRRCRLEKRGATVLGWAEICVEATDSGSRVTWREDATPARLPAFTAGLVAACGRLLFGRVMRKVLAG